MAVDKVIISNFSALGSKYGSTQLARIKSAIKALIAADKKRGLRSVVIAIDAALAPHYILLLGAADVIPYQSLINPVYSPGGDDDIDIPSDLPYAGDVPFSRDG